MRAVWTGGPEGKIWVTTISEMFSKPNPVQPKWEDVFGCKLGEGMDFCFQSDLLWWLPGCPLFVADLRRVQRVLESPRIPPQRRSTMSAGQGPMMDPPTRCVVPTVSERLKAEETNLADRLGQVRDLRAALDANPQTAEIIDALSKLGHVGY